MRKLAPQKRSADCPSPQQPDKSKGGKIFKPRPDSDALRLGTSRAPESADEEVVVEPERYELHAAPIYQFDLSRRNFFKLLGCGIVVVLFVKQARAQESGRRGSGRGQRGSSDIGAWLHIGEDGAVTVYTGKVEVGQNARTALTQVVAEELRVPMSAIRMVMADTQLVPYDAGTFGSQTTPSMSPQLRRVAAAAREALIDLAADLWEVERASLVAENGKVTDKKKQTIEYGKLAKDQKLTRAVTDDSPISSPGDWKIAGHPAHKVNGEELITGKHKYTSDQTLPDMLHGKVLRPAAFGATLVSLDSKSAEAMGGVTVVHDGDFVGVTAPNELAASRAIVALKAEWKASPQSSGKTLFDDLKKPLSGEQRGGGRGRGGPSTVGSIEEGLATADVKLSATYNISYIAHAPLEPRAAVAKWDGDKLTVWVGTQRPFGVRSELAQALRLSEENVRCITPDTGSGYGGKHSGEHAVEAARLAKAAKRPVKLVWTREEEFTWAYFRPAGVIEVNSGARKDGTLTAWEFHNYNSGSSGLRTLYDVPNQRHEFHPARSPLRQGSYRALAATANHFARESHMDELARALKIDPLEFRRKNLKDARLRAVLDAAAEKFGWGKQERVENHGRGISCGSEKGSYIAACAEVFADRKTGKVNVLRVVAAFECGAIINPDQLKNQIEGATIMGLGGALFEAIEFANGKILNPHFADYRVPRFSDAPQVEVVLLDRKDLKSAGAGETPIVGIAPAVGNAIFDATGIRLRSLPMVPEGLKA